MIELRQSTAGQEIPLGYFLDSTDGNAEETGLTIANTNIKLWKWGATTLANKNSGGGTHISNGIYYATLDDTDSNTLGALIIFVHVAGALAVKVECAVITQNAWDSKYSTDKLQVHADEITNGLITAAAIATDAIGASELAEDAINEIRDAILSDSTPFDGANIDASISSRLAPAGTLATVTAVTNDVGITQAGADKVWSTAARTLTSFGTLVADIWGAGTRTLTGFSTALALSVWDVLEAAITTASSIGLKLKTNLDAAITSRQPSGNVDLNADQSGITIGTCNTNTDMVGTANAALASVCTEARLSELAAANIPADVDTLLTRVTASVALASVCTEARLAELAVANLPADIDGIKGKTVNLPADPASETNVDANEAKIDSLQTDVTTIKAKTDNQPAGIPKNVALNKFPFLMIDSTDHITPKTGLTVTAQTNKDGAGFAGSTNSPVEVANGWYEIDWIQAEMNFGIAAWKFTAPGADQRDITVKTST